MNRKTMPGRINPSAPLQNLIDFNLTEESSDELNSKLAKSMSLQVVQNKASDSNNNIYSDSQLRPTPEMLNENYQLLYENLYKSGEPFNKADLFIYVMYDSEHVHKVVPFRMETFQKVHSEYFNKILTIPEKSVFKPPSHHAVLDKMTNKLWIPEVEPERVCYALGNMSREDTNFEVFNDNKAIDLYKIYDYLGVQDYKEMAAAIIRTKINENNFMTILKLSPEFESACAGYVKMLANEKHDAINELEKTLTEKLNSLQSELDETRKSKLSYQANYNAKKVELKQSSKQFSDLKNMVTNNWSVFCCTRCRRYFTVNKFEQNVSATKFICPYRPCDPKMGQLCKDRRDLLNLKWRKVFGEQSLVFPQLKSKNQKTKDANPESCTIM